MTKQDSFAQALAFVGLNGQNIRYPSFENGLSVVTLLSIILQDTYFSLELVRVTILDSYLENVTLTDPRKSLNVLYG